MILIQSRKKQSRKTKMSQRTQYLSDNEICRRNVAIDNLNKTVSVEETKKFKFDHKENSRTNHFSSSSSADIIFKSQFFQRLDSF